VREVESGTGRPWHPPRKQPPPRAVELSPGARQTQNRRRSAESERHVYAIVRAGGRQEKVAVGDVLVVDRLAGEAGSSVSLTPLLLVDGETVTSAADALASTSVTAEVIGNESGPKIIIQKYKNKTGYKKRQGHRQRLTRLRVTAIG